MVDRKSPKEQEIKMATYRLYYGSSSPFFIQPVVSNLCRVYYYGSEAQKKLFTTPEENK